MGTFLSIIGAIIENCLKHNIREKSIIGSSLYCTFVVHVVMNLHELIGRNIFCKPLQAHCTFVVHVVKNLHELIGRIFFVSLCRPTVLTEVYNSILSSHKFLFRV